MKSIKFSPPDITQEEIDEVVDTLKSGWITTGPKTKLFESEIAKYCNTNRAITMSSATACMEMVLRFLGVGQGDEVITSAYTYTASASVIHHVGAKIILVDTFKDSYLLDYEMVRKSITPKTKAIIAVDISGIMCDYEALINIANEKKYLFKANSVVQKSFGRICVIADAAHSFGASNNNIVSGSAADFSCFSFHAVKNLTTGEGGALTWKSIASINDDLIYREFMLLILHGQTKDALSKSQLGMWEYDIVAPNFKFNMTDILASIGLVQLKRYKELLSKRHDIIKFYNNSFADLEVQCPSHFSNNFFSSGHLYQMRIPDFDEKKRNEMIQKLAECGIPTNVHFKPLPLLTAYKNLGFNIADFPNAYAMYSNEITLPLHTLLSSEELDYIAKNVRLVIQQIRNRV